MREERQDHLKDLLEKAEEARKQYEEAIKKAQDALKEEAKPKRTDFIWEWNDITTLPEKEGSYAVLCKEHGTDEGVVVFAEWKEGAWKTSNGVLRSWLRFKIGWNTGYPLPIPVTVSSASMASPKIEPKEGGENVELGMLDRPERYVTEEDRKKLGLGPHGWHHQAPPPTPSATA